MSQEIIPPTSDGRTSIPMPESGSAPASYLIAGLGNPGREYQKNRHNVGFMFLNHFSARLGASFGRVEMKALVAKVKIDGSPLVLVKPQTYMNLSGQAVGSFLRYYKVSLSNLLVVYDDVDLPFGTLRLRPGGGSGGHNGMKSIIQSVGSQGYPRLRIGVNRPPGRMEAADYVLQDFSSSEAAALEDIFTRANEAVMLLIQKGLDAAMNFANAPD